MEWSWDYAEQCLSPLLKAFGLTVGVTVVSSLIALALGLVLALAARSHRRPLALATRGLIEFIRGTPLLIQLYLLFFALPQLGVTLTALTAGVLGLAIHHATYMAETYRAGIDSVPRGQWDAARSLDLSAFNTWRRIILPQALPPTLAAQGNWVILMFKQSALLAAITVEELFFRAQELGNQSLDYVEPLTIAALLYLAVSYPTSLLVRYFERRYSVEGRLRAA